MELQKQQLQQLSDWLTVTEERIQKMESQLLADDLESLQKQLEEHKVDFFACCVICIGEVFGRCVLWGIPWLRNLIVSYIYDHIWCLEKDDDVVERN